MISYEDTNNPAETLPIEYGGDWIAVGAESAQDPATPRYAGQAIIGELNIGGSYTPEGELRDAQKAYLLKITDEESPDYKMLVRQAEAAGIPVSDYAVAVAYPDKDLSHASGLTFLQPFEAMGKDVPMRQKNVIGREGNLKWIKFGGDSIDPKWSPFDDNRSVSRHHLEIIVGNSGLAVIGASKSGAHTDIKGPNVKPFGQT